MGNLQELHSSMSALATLLEALVSREEFFDRLAKIGFEKPDSIYQSILNADPTKSHKYSAWVLFMLEKGEFNVDPSTGDIADLLGRFDRTLPRLTQKDLYQYETPEEVENAIADANALATYEKASKIGSGSKLVSSKNGYEIYAITTLDACARSSAGTKWCISDKSTAKDYLEAGEEFYLIFKGGNKYAMLTVNMTYQSHPDAAMFDLHDNRLYIEDPKLISALSFLPEKVQAILPTMENLTRNMEMAYYYARFILMGPFPAGESAIAKSPQYASYYAQYVIKGPFPAGEPAIATDAFYSYGYALHAIKKPFPAGEPAIANSIWDYSYAMNVLELPELEAHGWSDRYEMSH